MGGSRGMYQVTVNQTVKSIRVDDDNLFVNDEEFPLDISEIDERALHVIKDDQSYTIHIKRIDQQTKTVTLIINNKLYEVSLKDKMDLLLERLGMDKLADNQLDDLKAPMPGQILEISVKDGDEVKQGDRLLILEAMKMENVLKATADATVKSVKVKKGENVEKNQVLIQF